MDRLCNLARHHFFICWFIGYSKYANRNREVRILHPPKYVRHIWFRCRLIMNDDIVDGYTILADRHDFRRLAVESDSLRLVFAKQQWLPVLKIEHFVIANCAL